MSEPEIIDAIVPFWLRITHFLSYPFKSKHAMIMIAGVGLLSSLSLYLGLLGLFASFLMPVIMLKYSFEALQATCTGDFSPPHAGKDVIVNDIYLIYKQFFLFVMLIVAYVAIIKPMGPIVSIFILLIFFLILPAMVIVLILKDSLFQAINPLVLFKTAQRIGPPYLLVFCFAALLYIAPLIIGGYIIGNLPAFFYTFVTGMAKNYYILAMYNLLGYVILQYQKKLNYAVDLSSFLDKTS
ncbi:MAG: hypothetical protein GY874_07620 [Desulfobacteraceae bacterium]|nr:hypothetical protein [Desulfobacteraceae bacterium]